MADNAKKNLSKATYPLAGVKVLDLSRILAGPWLTQILADLGAEVVKVEPPNGDDTRIWGPPFVGRGRAKTAAYFHACNRGKISVVADLQQPTELNQIKQLAARADVVVENFKVGGLKKFGLNFESVKAMNDKIIYCSITGFGQQGPYAHRGGYDYIVQGMSGFMDITGPKDGEPQKIGVALADIITALYGAIGILAALKRVAELRHQGLKGGAEWIDMALFDCMVGVLANQASNYFASGQSPIRLGNQHPNIVPYQVFYAGGNGDMPHVMPHGEGNGLVNGNGSSGEGLGLDAAKNWGGANPAAEKKPFVLACGNDRQFQKLMGLLLGDKGVELANHKKFRTNAARLQHKTELVDMLSALFAEYNRDDLLQKLEQIDVPAGPINSVAEALTDPQILARGMQLTLPLVADGGDDAGDDDVATNFEMSEAGAKRAMGMLQREQMMAHQQAIKLARGQAEKLRTKAMDYLRTPIVFKNMQLATAGAVPTMPPDASYNEKLLNQLVKSWDLRGESSG